MSTSSAAVNHADRFLLALSRSNGTKQYQQRQLQAAFWNTCARIISTGGNPSAAHAGTIGNGFGGQPAAVSRVKWRIRPYPSQLGGSVKSSSWFDPASSLTRS